MRFSIFLFLFIGLTHLYSQNIDLNQLTKLRETNYKIVDKELLKMGWEKTISKELIGNVSDLVIPLFLEINNLKINNKLKISIEKECNIAFLFRLYNGLNQIKWKK